MPGPAWWDGGFQGSPGMRLRSVLFLLCVVVALAACGQAGQPAPTPPAAATSAALSPELQAIYDRSCASCHSVAASGAPQSGDRSAWTVRVAQGADVLLDHTLNGFNAMPPLGACMDCSEEQFRALIAHMAGGESAP